MDDVAPPSGFNVTFYADGDAFVFDRNKVDENRLLIFHVPSSLEVVVRLSSFTTIFISRLHMMCCALHALTF